MQAVVSQSSGVPEAAGDHELCAHVDAMRRELRTHKESSMSKWIALGDVPEEQSHLGRLQERKVLGTNTQKLMEG